MVQMRLLETKAVHESIVVSKDSELRIISIHNKFCFDVVMQWKE